MYGTLTISRVLLTVQYSVVLFWVTRQKRGHLSLPITLNIGIYAISASVFAILTTAFSGSPSLKVSSVCYFIMALEAAGTIAISCRWRILSFKRTHLCERMGLLTLIVIGEGAIGVTKTIGKMMAKGLDLESTGLIMCIIIILVSVSLHSVDLHALPFANTNKVLHLDAVL